MAIIKNEFPILEYDPDSPEIIAPGHDLTYPGQFPEKCLFAFLGEAVDRYAREHQAVVADGFETINRIFNLYIVEQDGQRIAMVASPVGAAVAVALLDWLIAYGSRTILAVGSCGVLTDRPENAFLIPTRALRDEGTSYHYLPPARYIDLDRGMAAAVAASLDRQGIPWQYVTTWTTDGFFRETAEMTAYRRQEGCAVVEMECAALAACAEKRGARFGQLLYTADSLATAEYEERGFGQDSIEPALRLGLQALKEMGRRS